MNTNKKLNISEYLKKKNVKRFMLFFLIAFIFLIFSKLSNDYKQTIKLRINLVNLEDEIILSNDSLNIIDAYAEAKGFALIPFIFKKYKSITLDAKKDVVSTSGSYIFDVQKNQFLIDDQLGTSYKVLSLKPDSLIISYSKRASKLVPVNLKTDINYALGFDIKDSLTLSTDSIKIVGSNAEVNAITSLSTKQITLNDVNTDIKKSINLDISDYKNIEIFPKSIVVTAEVERFTEGTKEIAIKITNKPSDAVINYFPKTVTVAYYVDLENYKTIKASDFSVECSYTEIKDNQSYLIPKLTKQPKYVKRTSIKQKRIDFIKL